MQNSLCGTMDQIFQTVEANKQTYVDFLCRICAYEAKAYDKVTIDSRMD